MEAFLIKAAQLIAALSFLVIIHEFGHYTFARIFGIKVEKFYLFFNPGFSLFKWKPKPAKNAKPGKASWRDTLYGIGWLPLGGYVKIAGMIDESMDKEQMKQPAKPWEFRSKPAWQRLLVMLGGVVNNFILAILIYAGIAFYWGERYIELRDSKYGFDFVPAAQKVGFRNGDIPIIADGKELHMSQKDVFATIAQAKEVKVLRGGDTVSIALPEKFIFELNKARGFMNVRIPVVIKDLVAGEPAILAGLQKGDRIIAVDDVATPTFSELTPALAARKGRKSTLTVERGGQTLKLEVTPNEYGKLGFQLTAPEELLKTQQINYGLLESFPRGWENGTTILTTYVTSLKHVFSSEGAKSLGGFGAMGSMFPEKWDWYSFWQITAFFSVALAFMNIIPIPGLDGGHVMFLLYEMIVRREAPEKVIEIAQYIGMGLLLCILLYANGMDLMRAVLN